MASRFDPRAFIAAEEARIAARASDRAAVSAATPAMGTAEISHSSPGGEDAIATIATIAAPALSNTPWADDVTRFITADRPDWVPEEHWDELVGEAELIERKWGDTVAALGWSVLDLHGCPQTPLGRIHGQSGLTHLIVTLLSPVKITAVNSRGAELQPFKGAPMRYRPSPRLGAVPLWVAYSPASGP